MKNREVASPHPLQKAAQRLLSSAAVASFLVALFYLLFFETVAFFSLVALLAIGIRVWRDVRISRFSRAHEGKTFLLFTRRHGWHEFVSNNVEPVLPERWEIVWFVRPGFEGKPERHELQVLLDGWLPVQDRPIAIRPRGRRLEQRSLRHKLQPLKLQHGMRRDPAIQAEVRDVLEHTF